MDSGAVYRHLKVLAFEETNKLALTDKDVESYLDYAAFLIALSTGKKTQPSVTQRNSHAERIVKGFTNYPLEAKQFLCRSQVVFSYLKYVWDNADADERSRITQAMLGEGKVNAFDGTLVLAFDHVEAMNAWRNVIELPYYYELN